MLRVLVALVLVGGCQKEERASGDEPTRGSPPPRATPASATPQASKEAVDELNRPWAIEGKDFAGALAEALPGMEDVTESSSDGTLLFTVWAGKKMRWTDVAVAKNETSVAKVMKDSRAERGKRMCVKGSIIQIARDGDLFVGLMGTGGYGLGDVVHFFAAGSTGELVQRSRGRFCGVVTGRFTYSNAGGGTTHAVDAVGMFDLPENRGAAPK